MSFYGRTCLKVQIMIKNMIEINKYFCDKKELFKKNKREIITIAIILGLGIFLRTYHFSDWLRFNADQSRDAALIKNIVEGKVNTPLLGPKAGGTEFRLGPAFYYFQFASAKVFGEEPEKLAYPDLLFSILSILLFFLLARIFFGSKI